MPPFPFRSSPFVPALYRPLPMAPRLALPLFGCQIHACFPGSAEGALTGYPYAGNGLQAWRVERSVSRTGEDDASL